MQRAALGLRLFNTTSIEAGHGWTQMDEKPDICWVSGPFLQMHSIIAKIKQERAIVNSIGRRDGQQC
eukprot:scaffold183449_cov18-Prasinocladus_malaysianus.AAC.3